jgi:hypothetical protein
LKKLVSIAFRLKGAVSKPTSDRRQENVANGQKDTTAGAPKRGYNSGSAAG